MTKDELRAALTEIDNQLAIAEANAAPERARLRPFEDAIRAIQDRREVLLEECEGVYVGKCEFCSTILFEGDKACRIEDVGYSCEACSPTWSEMRADYERDKDSIDQEDYDEAIAVIDARIAAGLQDAKAVSPL